MALQALTVVTISGVASFTASPGCYYLVDTAAVGSDVTVQLVPVAATDATSWLVVKNTDGVHDVSVTPAAGDDMNGSPSANVLSAAGQSHQYMPGTPAGYGTGWTSW